MPKTSELFLRVKEADEADYGNSIVRIHNVDKPRDINWGEYVRISLDRKNWVTCKMEPAGDTGIGKIYIGIRLRGLLNKDTVGVQIAQPEVPCNFYARKATPWKGLLYIMTGIVVTLMVAFLVHSLGLIGG